MPPQITSEELPSIYHEQIGRKANYGLFEVGNRTFPYFKPNHEDISYGAQSIEIPVALHVYNKQRSLSSPSEGRILEIGCVLPKFLPAWQKKIRQVERDSNVSRVFPHLCVDPEDSSAMTGVISKGVQDITLSPDRFDLIISLSNIALATRTEAPTQTKNMKINLIIEYVRKLRKALTKGGVLMISLPWEYNFPDLIGESISDGLIHHYLDAFHTDDFSEESEGPNLIWKMNRTGYGLGGNTWQEVDILKSPNISVEEGDRLPSAKTVYFMLWGATEIW